MKPTSTFLILISILLLSCNDSDDCCVTPPDNFEGNKLAYLKVDYTTNQFQGGMVFSFGDDQPDTFTISSDYHAPGDFGSIQLYYTPLNELIFDGTILWMGLGEMQFPESLMSADSFETISQTVSIPDEALLEPVMYDEYAYYPEEIDYTSIWENIDNLNLVKSFRDSNPESSVKFFLYTPSVGVGNPEDWYWLVLLKN